MTITFKTAIVFLKWGENALCLESLLISINCTQSIVILVVFTCFLECNSIAIKNLFLAILDSISFLVKWSAEYAGLLLSGFFWVWFCICDSWSSVLSTNQYMWAANVLSTYVNNKQCPQYFKPSTKIMSQLIVLSRSAIVAWSVWTPEFCNSETWRCWTYQTT